MSHQQKGFRASFIIHAAVILLLISLNSSMGRFSKPVIIDFSVEDTAAKGDPGKAPAPKGREARPKANEQMKPQTAVAKQEPMPQQAAGTSKTATEGQAAVASPGPSSASGRPSVGSSSPAAGIAKTEGKGSSSHGEGPSGEAMKQSYLKEHFAYIRKLVQQKLSYPGIARKMGWEGKVIISFVVCTDGHARDITIREGSGFDLLDRNAVAAVREATPFPKPPVEAQLIIPIDYRLN